MQITIDKILKQQNRTRYWLSKNIDCNYNSLVRLCNGETTSISFSLLQDICVVLHCSPNDVMQIEE